VLDPDLGWVTSRLEVSPLEQGSADELFAVLDDSSLHDFVGGAPLDRQTLTERFARLASRRSPDGAQVWANWVLRDRTGGQAVGTLQATLPAGGPSAGFAEVAWVVGRPWQGRGLASEAARSLVDRLLQRGWTVAAHIHPEHLASQAVARAAGLSPTAVTHGGETRWLRTPALPGADPAAVSGRSG
jgi:RimJ/RimL family protein N-acetyltransferase